MLAVWSGPRQLAGHPGAAPGPGSQQDTAPPIQHKDTGPVAAAAAAAAAQETGAHGGGGRGGGTGSHRGEREGRWMMVVRMGGWRCWVFFGNAVMFGGGAVVVVVDEGGLGWI